MRRIVFGTLGAMVAGMALVTAQSAPPRSGAQMGSSATNYTEQGSATYTGCLEAGAASGTFVLRNVSQDVKASAKGSSGVAASSGAMATQGQSFALIGAPSGFSYDKNLNHRVQITGTLIGATSGATAPAASTAPGASALPSSPAGSANDSNKGASMSSGASNSAAGASVTGANPGASPSSGANSSAMEPGSPAAGSPSAVPAMPDTALGSTTPAQSTDTAMQSVTVSAAKSLSDRCAF